jgi:hypothetical protein
MHRACFVSLFLLLTPTFLLSQSNPAPLVSQSTRDMRPLSASQDDPKAQAQIFDSYGKLPLSFEANHGQTDTQVKFLSRIGGYMLFLTGDEAVMALSAKKINQAKMAAATHSLNSGVAATKARSVLRMKLRNANPAAKVTGVDELAGTSNYFIGNDPTKWQTNVPTFGKVKYEGIYSGIDLVYYGNHRQLEYDFIVAPGADPHRIQFDIRGAKRIRQDEHGDLVLKIGEDEIRWHKPVVYQEKDGARQLVAAQYTIRNTNRVGFELAKYDASRPLYIDPLIYSTYLGGSGDDNAWGIAVDSSGSAYIAGSTNSTDFPTANPLQPAFGGNLDGFVAKLNPSGTALVYSTYLGGSAFDSAVGIAVDSSGNAYVTGGTESTDFPTMNPLQPASGGGFDAFVAKLNPSGSALLYSTYLGGSEYDAGNGIAVDSSGNAYVAGSTSSTNFPTDNPLQPAYGGGYDGFVTELNSSGSALVYSTYLGGSDWEQANHIAVDSSGSAYVTGITQSTDFPTTPGAFQTVCNGGSGCSTYQDAFVAKLNPSGTALVYSTYLGGSNYDGGYGIAVDSSGNAYITGDTWSTDFPTKNPLQPFCGHCPDNPTVFVTKLNPSGSALVYSTFLGGGAGDVGDGIAVDSSGNAYVAGYTSSNNFPTMNPLQPRPGGVPDAFVSKFNPSGTALVYSTYLGGSGSDYGYAIALDGSGNAYVAGGTSSTDFPTVNPLQPANAGGSDAFVSKIANYIGTLVSSSNPSAFGQSVTFTATVTSLGSGTPTGTITFTYGGTTLCNAVTLSGGTAACAYSALPGGTDLVIAAYSGDSNFNGGSVSLSQTVNQASTTLMLVSSLNPSGLDSPVTFTATITPQYGGQATGTVTFKNGFTALGSGAVSGNAASLTTSALAIGTHSITAVYSGDSNFTGSTSNVVSQVVTKATTTTSLASSVNPSVQGKAVTFTASVSSLAGTPTGKVEFLNGTKVLATVTLKSGSAKYSTSTLPAGSNSISAVYQGDANNNGSTSGPVNQFVLAVTTTTLKSSPNPSMSGEAVTFTATVTSSIGAPPNGESVSFMKGTTVLGTGTLSGGSATFTISTLKVGTNSVKAVYSGDSNFSGSTSNVVEQVVEK